MDGNKDEALRCVQIAKEALASGDKQRALRVLKIAQRLDGNLAVEDLLVACGPDNYNTSASPAEERAVGRKPNDPSPRKVANFLDGDRNCSDEHVKLIREIRKHKDYYAILGVEKSCSVEEIRKAYRKLSLKVHPDKNNAPGSEEAFKIVSKAFKCLSDKESRRQYDQIGFVKEFEFKRQHNVRRRRSEHDVFHDNSDPDEIFRSFFFGSQTGVFRSGHVYRAARGAPTPFSQQGDNAVGGGFNVMMLLQILPILFVFLVAFFPFFERDYSLQKTFTYQIPKVTEKYGVEFYVKSSNFDHQFPQGSSSRVNLEHHVVRDYRNMLGHYCHMEMQRRQWSRNYPTPHCDRLQNFGVA